MGMEVVMVASKGPVLPHPLEDPQHLSRLASFNVEHIRSHLSYVFQGIHLTRTMLEGRVPLIGFSGAPWTLACYMIEGEGGAANAFNKAKTWIYKYPAGAHQLLQSITDVVIEYLVGQASAGAQVLMLFDSWAGVLSPACFTEFCFPYLKQIADQLKQRIPSSIPLICFAKGANSGLEELSINTKYDVLGLDWTISPQEARRLTGGRVALQGNLDPCVLYAEAETIQDEVKKMIKEFGTQGYIANLGHGLQPTMKPENVGVFVSAVQQYTEH